MVGGNQTLHATKCLQVFTASAPHNASSPGPVCGMKWYDVWSPNRDSYWPT